MSSSIGNSCSGYWEYVSYPKFSDATPLVPTSELTNEIQRLQEMVEAAGHRQLASILGMKYVELQCAYDTKCSVDAETQGKIDQLEGELKFEEYRILNAIQVFRRQLDEYAAESLVAHYIQDHMQLPITEEPTAREQMPPPDEIQNPLMDEQFVRFRVLDDEVQETAPSITDKLNLLHQKQSDLAEAWAEAGLPWPQVKKVAAQSSDNDQQGKLIVIDVAHPGQVEEALRESELSEEVVCGLQGIVLPVPEKGKTFVVNSFLEWLVAIAIGILVALSIGTLSGLLNPVSIRSKETGMIWLVPLLVLGWLIVKFFGDCHHKFVSLSTRQHQTKASADLDNENFTHHTVRFSIIQHNAWLHHIIFLALIIANLSLIVFTSTGMYILYEAANGTPVHPIALLGIITFGLILHLPYVIYRAVCGWLETDHDHRLSAIRAYQRLYIEDRRKGASMPRIFRLAQEVHDLRTILLSSEKESERFDHNEPQTSNAQSDHSKNIVNGSTDGLAAESPQMPSEEMDQEKIQMVVPMAPTEDESENDATGRRCNEYAKYRILFPTNPKVLYLTYRLEELYRELESRRITLRRRLKRHRLRRDSARYQWVQCSENLRKSCEEVIDVIGTLTEREKAFS